MTSNGVVLGTQGGRKLQRLVDAGLRTLNLSLDTLVPAKFEFMTRRKGIENVRRCMEYAAEMGFGREGSGRRLKINCVVMRGVNDDEMLDFVELTRERNIDVRFIEYMPFDVSTPYPLPYPLPYRFPLPPLYLCLHSTFTANRRRATNGAKAKCSPTPRWSPQSVSVTPTSPPSLRNPPTTPPKPTVSPATRAPSASSRP